MQTSAPRQRLLHFAAKLLLNGIAAALIVAVVVTASMLTGCTVMPLPGEVGTESMGAPKATPARIEAACPPLEPLRRTDADALTLRLAELDALYARCRAEALRASPLKPARFYP